MVANLGLSGNDLLVYALIYGFSQDGSSGFYGSARYIADSIGISRRAVMTILSKLTKNGLLIKASDDYNGIKRCCYKASLGGYEETSQGMKKLHRGYEETSQGGMKILHRGYEETSHNNKEYNIDNNKEDILTTSEEPPTQTYLDALFIAKELATLHRETDPIFKGNPKLWAKDIEKLLRIDGRDKEDVLEVLRWAKKPGCFWYPNIVSGAKLRKQYPVLLAQMQQEKSKNERRSPTLEETAKKYGIRMD